MSPTTLSAIRSRRAAGRSVAAGRGAVVALALGAALFSPRPDHSARAAPPADQATPLDHKDRHAIRKIVYEGGAEYAHPPIVDDIPGPEVLVVPRELEAVYKKNPVETLSLLRKIVEGGRPRDAKLAAGYAIALEDPHLGPWFSRGHDEDFDTYNDKRRETPREFHLWHVDRVIDGLKK
jgi:hypothetical protein